MTSDIFNHNRSHGRFAPFISFQRTEHYGLSAIATQDIPSGSELVICAHEFAITPDLARRVLDLPQTLEDRQTVVAFLVLGRKSEASPAREKLAPWLAYIQALPSPDQLNTPLFFNDEELALFQGTNMVGAIADRRQLWREEVESLDKVLREKLINLVVTLSVQTVL